MKSLKTAAALAGFVVVAGTAAPAFAQSAADVTPTSLNGAVNRLTQGPLDVMPLQVHIEKIVGRIAVSTATASGSSSRTTPSF